MAATLAWAATPASAATTTLAFPAVADTYVDASAPSTSFGGAQSMWVDAQPTKQTFLRFRVSGLDGARVVGVRLRLYGRDASPSGGTVRSMASDSWTEAMTYETRPSADGSVLGTFGPAIYGQYAEADLGPLLTNDQTVSLALTSTDADGARWAAREAGVTGPALLVDVERPASAGEVSEITTGTIGSSDPTYFASNHHVAVTAGGRELVVHGRHSSGVQLTWRDPGGSWQTASQGATTTGSLISGTGTGDWPASIAVARDASGVEHAWVAFGRASAHSSYPTVYLTRISGLDSAAGPSVGSRVAVDSTASGAYRIDVGFETDAAGRSVGALTWGRKTSTGHQLLTGWFTDLDTDAPSIAPQSVLQSSSSSGMTGTLETAAGGVRVVSRVGARLTVFGHQLGAAGTEWWRGAAGASTIGSPSATILDSGAILAAADAEPVSDNKVIVQRFSAAGAPEPVELTLDGYRMPTLATDGVRAWLVMVRASDGRVVSRELGPLGWSGVDREEIGAEGAGNLQYPNGLRRVTDRLRLVVRGPRLDATGTKNEVLSFDRPL